MAPEPSIASDDRSKVGRLRGGTGVRPMIEEVPLLDAESAIARMRAGKARFRMVLTTGH